MPTVAELGQKVKAKYPGAYDDLPDVELGQKIKAKFPGAYDDFTDTPAAATEGYQPAVGPEATHAVDVTTREPGTAGSSEGWLPWAAKTAAATGISTATSLGGLALGGLTAPVTGPVGPLVGEMAGSLAGRKINVALGLEEPGVGGDVLSVAGPLASRAVALGYRALRGRAPAAAQEMLDLGKQHGVRLSYGDVTQQPLAKRSEVLLEQVPLVGTAGFRKGQQAEVKQAAITTAEGLRDAMRQMPYTNLAEVQQAAAQGSKRAKDLLDDVANAGEDWNRILQTSGNLKAFRARQAAEVLYDNVEQLAQNAGAVPLKQTGPMLDQALAQVTTSKIPDQPLVNRLTQLKEALTSDPTTNTFTAMRQLRSDLGDIIDDYYKGKNAIVGAKGVHLLQQVKNSVESDMEDWALSSNHQPLRAMWRKADRFYRDEVLPFKNREVAKALTNINPDEVYSKFIQAGKGDRAQQFYKVLDPKGQAAVRYGMVAEALENSLQPTTGVFSPAKFAGSLERVREAQGVFFTGKAKWELDGMTKLMRHTERAGQFAENPPTGNRLIPLLGIGGIAALSPQGAATGAVSALGLRWLLTSQRGRSLLLAASDLKAGTPAMERIAEALTRELTRVAGPEALEGVTQ